MSFLPEPDHERVINEMKKWAFLHFCKKYIWQEEKLYHHFSIQTVRFKKTTPPSIFLSN